MCSKISYADVPSGQPDDTDPSSSLPIPLQLLLTRGGGKLTGGLWKEADVRVVHGQVSYEQNYLPVETLSHKWGVSTITGWTGDYQRIQ